VPIPVSFFPSAYKSEEIQTTETHVEGEIRLPTGQERRESQYSSYSASLPPREEQSREEKVHITKNRPSRNERDDISIRDERKPEHRHDVHVDIETKHHRREFDLDLPHLPHIHRPHLPHFHHTKTDIEYERREPHNKSETKFQFVRKPEHRHHHEKQFRFERRRGDTEIDVTEREYRSKFQPSYREEARVAETTVDPASAFRPSPKENIHITEEFVEPSTFNQDKMGYYDEDAPRKPSFPEKPSSPNTVTIPTHHIRMGDLLILQGRPCQVIRITTSSSTGQHRYLGVDLFTKQLHEESSFISNPSPSVVVQTMLGPVFKQYRVLDLQDGTVVAMTETGDVKQNIPVIDQSNLWSRLNEAFETGRGSVRVQVISDQGRELVVDMKILHGSRL